LLLICATVARSRGIFVSVDQKPRHIVEDMRRFGWELDGPELSPLLTILDASPYFTALRGSRPPEAYQIAHDLIERVRALSARTLVIDGVSSFAPEGDPTMDRSGFLRMLIMALEDNLDCTTLLTAPESGWADRAVAGIVELAIGPIGGEISRSLVVRAFADAPAAPIAHLFDIVDGQGLILK